MSERFYLPYSDGCFVCGHNNPHGLQVQFYVESDSVRVDLNFANHFNSFPKITHGGILSSILDEAMGWSAFIFSDVETFLFTRELSVTYKRTAPIGEPLILIAEYVGAERGGMFSTKGKIIDLEGKIITTSKGLFFPTSKEKMAETIPHLSFLDELVYHPKAIKYCK